MNNIQKRGSHLLWLDMTQTRDSRQPNQQIRNCVTSTSFLKDSERKGTLLSLARNVSGNVNGTRIFLSSAFVYKQTVGESGEGSDENVRNSRKAKVRASGGFHSAALSHILLINTIELKAFIW